VVQDDDLGLTASFNRMQAGLAEWQRLQAAFGTYVDLALAVRRRSAAQPSRRAVGTMSTRRRILRGHVNADHPIVEDLDDGQESARETEVNEGAVDWIFPNGYPSIPSRINAPWVEQKAAELGLARIRLIGQLQKRGRLTGGRH